MPIALTISVILALFSLAPVALGQERNSIEGRVTTIDNKSLLNVRVFLLNDVYGQRSQTYTDGSGRYQFRNLPAGNYYVAVEPAGTGYERQTQRVEVNPYNPSGTGGAEIFRIDFVLKPEKPARRAQPLDEPGKPETIFYQDVPPAAKEAYQEGLRSLKKDDLKAAEVALVHAIELFPDYYDALELLGSEYVKHAYYDSAAPLLARAVQVNKDAWRSFYGLGVSLIELDRRGEGLDALRRALTINAKSVNANMRLGLELAKNEQSYEEAIKCLTNVTRVAGKSLPDAYLALASIYSKQQKYNQAANALESYLESSPPSDQRDNIKRKIDELRQKASKVKPASSQ